jgi:wyosine [tRNA(Phe)-imidazoG37] synthetase (radical SAM superfamily)
MKIDKRIKIENFGFENQIFFKNINKEKNFLEISSLLKNHKNQEINKNNKIIELFSKEYLTAKSCKDLKEEFVLSNHEILEFERLSELKKLDYLIYRYKYNFYPKEKFLDAYPPCVQIEPASVCNFRCVMCYQADKNFSNNKSGHMGFMDYTLFKKVIDEIEGEVYAITFASRGEPTLNKELGKFLEYAKDKFVNIKINTNLSTMTERLANQIFENNVNTLVISADSSDKESYEKIRVKGKFEKLLKNLETLKKAKENFKNCKTVIRVSGVRINEEQSLEDMSKVYSDMCDAITYVKYVPWESSYNNPVNDIKEPCSDLWRRTFIWYDGKCNPCDYDYKSFLSKFSLKNESLKNIWNSKYYNEIRQAHLDKKRNKIFPCDRCPSV